jgi:Flp pilus assembly protein TadD
MHRRYVGSLMSGLVVLALAVVPLAGCSAGASTFGDNKLAAAELPQIGTHYTAQTALDEARAHFRNNDFGYAASLYKRAAELAPKNSEAYVGLGASYDRLGRFELADRVYETLFKVGGASVQYYNNVGYSYLLRGNLNAAVTNFKKAAKLDPDNLVVANNMQLAINAARA